jgi:hypothetical protein
LEKSPEFIAEILGFPFLENLNILCEKFGLGLRHLLEWKKGFVLAGFSGWSTLDWEKETQQNSKEKNTFSKRLD